MGLITQFISKLGRHPLAAMRRALYHLTVGRLRYSRGKDYDAYRFWSDRFGHYGLTLTAVGDQGLSEVANQERHEAARRLVLAHCAEQGLDFTSARVLDIGCGTGFFAEAIESAGATDYTGIDITDALFHQLEERYPGFVFVRRDVTSDKITGTYDLVLMIDFIQHILSPKKLRSAISSAAGCLTDGGTLILAPVSKAGRRVPLFYFVRTWSLDEVLDYLGDGVEVNEIPYRDNCYMLGVTKHPDMPGSMPAGQSRRPG
jgi:SAM-dependent methyltransferase